MLYYHNEVDTLDKIIYVCRGRYYLYRSSMDWTGEGEDRSRMDLTDKGSS